MAPPELTADAPVLDILQPVVIDFLPAFGEEADQAIFHGITGLNGLRISQEPLLAEAGFHGNIRPLAEADIILVGLLLG